MKATYRKDHGHEVEGGQGVVPLSHVSIFDEERVSRQGHGADALIGYREAAEFLCVYAEKNRPSLLENDPT